jgi:hypothetical protein
MKLTIIRGLPGSGKSTLAHTLATNPECQVFEADQYFNTEDGYKFDRDKLKEAHADCLARTRAWLEAGNDAIVSNTFTTKWELRPYFDLAIELNITPQVIECQNNYGSVHNVPASTIKNMRARFEHDIADDIPFDQQGLKQYVENNPSLVKCRDQGNGLYVLKYTKKVFYNGLWNPYLEACRGSVVDKDYNPISLPLIKIYNYGIEKEAPVLDPNTEVTAFRKVNGFMVCVTWHKDEVLVSTTGSLTSDFVKYAQDVIDVQGIRQALTELCHSYHNKSFIFECVSPEDPHIVPEEPGLYLLAVRTKDWNSKPKAKPKQLDKLSQMLGISPVEHHRTTVGELLKKVRSVKHEGFVFYTDDGISSKLKSPYYLVSKWLARNPDTSKIATDGFKQTVDEEYYPLIDAVRADIKYFTGLTEQQRLQWIRDFLWR